MLTFSTKMKAHAAARSLQRQNKLAHHKERNAVGSPLYSCPTAGSQALAALCRYPARTAFAWDGGTLTYRAVHDLIGRMR